MARALAHWGGGKVRGFNPLSPLGSTALTREAISPRRRGVGEGIKVAANSFNARMDTDRASSGGEGLA